MTTPATNKSQQFSLQKTVYQSIETQRIPIQEYNKELIAHLANLLLDNQEKYFEFIRSFEKIKLEGQVEAPKNGLINYLTKMYKSQESFIQQFLPKVKKPAFEELTIIAKKIIKKILRQLTIEQRQKYRRILEFSMKFWKNNEKLFDEEDISQKIVDQKHLNKQKTDKKDQLVTIDDLVRLDILMHFLLKNHFYQEMFDIDQLISPVHICDIFGIKTTRYLRLKQRFQEAFSILQSVHQQALSDYMKLLCIVQLRQRIYLNQRKRKQITHKKRRIFSKSQRKTIIKYQPFGNNIKFQFCQISLLSKCTIHARQRSKQKQDALVKLVLSVSKQQIINIKQQLITIKEETRTSLESLIQLYNQILSKSFEKVKNYDVQLERQNQIEACRWIYLSRVVTQKNSSIDTLFYKHGKPMSNFNKTFNIILKKALQRYQVFAGVSLSLLHILHHFPQPPMIYICRFEYSYNEIKGTTFPLKTQQEKDLKCTQIIGICQNKILFSALRNSKITDWQFKQFLIMYFSNFRKDKKYSIALNEFQHNHKNSWHALGIIIFELKSKFGFNVFILNYPLVFLQHLSINTCLRHLLEINKDQIGRENFFFKGPRSLEKSHNNIQEFIGSINITKILKIYRIQNKPQLSSI